MLSIDSETLAVEILEDARAAVTSVLHATEGGDTLVLSDNFSGLFNLFGEAAGTSSGAEPAFSTLGDVLFMGRAR